jgi:hypothetical protein
VISQHVAVDNVRFLYRNQERLLSVFSERCQSQPETQTEAGNP